MAAPPTAVQSSGATPHADVPLPHFEVEVSVVPLRDVAGKIASKMEDLRTANEAAQRTVTELAEARNQPQQAESSGIQPPVLHADQPQQAESSGIQPPVLHADQPQQAESSGIQPPVP
ncbi:hypothetical protein Nepgr_000561 [Nepenthes gracilis]|uniref:Uncharacterized protein n=1 Tax=Nepenthes gracilis TaxID=150966 RepID=A0AAD3P3Z7_NEPGR|nr:hypothetical protein Nepgr_000561 [Nepenthes gracilis]